MRTFMGRWSKPADWDVARFRASHALVAESFKEWLGHKGKWIYQLEKTDTTVDRPIPPAPAVPLCPCGVPYGTCTRVSCNSSAEARDADAARNAWIDIAAAAPVEVKENWHYQCYMYSSDKMRPLALAKLIQTKLPGFHIQVCSDAGQHALKKYSMKADTRVDGPWADQKIRPEYDGSDVKTYDQLWTYQKQIVDMVRLAPDDRRVNWVCNPVGCSGKTTLVKFMTKDDKCDALGLSHGAANDLANLVMQHQNRNCYVFDLPRTKPGSYHHSDIYSMIEKLKDGRVINLKYNTAIVDMRVPHVWVFSNELPQMTALTHDRLHIYQIDGNGPDSRLAEFDFKAYEKYKHKQAVDLAVKKLKAADAKKDVLAEAKELYQKEKDAASGAEYCGEERDRPLAQIRAVIRPAIEAMVAQQAGPDFKDHKHSDFRPIRPAPLSVDQLNSTPGPHHDPSQGREPDSPDIDLDAELAMYLAADGKDRSPMASPIPPPRNLSLKRRYADLSAGVDDSDCE